MIFTDNNAAKPMLREQAKQMAPFHYYIISKEHHSLPRVL